MPLTFAVVEAEDVWAALVVVTAAVVARTEDTEVEELAAVAADDLVAAEVATEVVAEVAAAEFWVEEVVGATTEADTEDDEEETAAEAAIGVVEKPQVFPAVVRVVP